MLIKCEWLNMLVNSKPVHMSLCGPWLSPAEPKRIPWTACEWGCVKAGIWLRNRRLRRDPHTSPRLKSLPARLWFPHAKTSGWTPMCCSPEAQLLLNVFMWFQLSGYMEQFQKDRGQSASTDEFWMCWRWFIRALKRSAGCPSHTAHPVIDHNVNWYCSH